MEQHTRIVNWMQQALDQRNETGASRGDRPDGQDGDGDRARDRGGGARPVAAGGAARRALQKAPEEFAAHLTATWRAEHLFNLERSLSLYDKH